MAGIGTNPNPSVQRRTALLVLVALLGLALLTTWYLSRDWQPPVLREVDFQDRVMKGENQTITVTVDEKDPAPSISLMLNGTTLSIPMTSDLGNGTVIYSLSFNPSYISSKEGGLDGGIPRPNLVVKDKSGNEATASVRFLVNLEAPQVSGLGTDRVALGQYTISAEISDESPFSAYLELPNGSQISMAKSAGRYSVDMSTLTDLNFTFEAVDVYNMTSSFYGSIEIPDRDKFEMWLPANFTKELSLSLFDYSPIVRGFFDEGDYGSLTSVLTLAQENGSSVPKNLAYQVLDQIWRDNGVVGWQEKRQVAREVLSLYLSLNGEVQRLSQIYALNNATRYFGSSASLRNEIGDQALLATMRELAEDDGINKDFDNPRKHSSLFRLAKYVPDIVKYPKEWREGAIQIDDIIYRVCRVDPHGESDTWLKAVKPAVQYIVNKLDTGEASYELGIADSRTEAWTRRQRLLPLELATVNITSGDLREPTIAMIRYNVNPNQELGGKSPQEWLETMAKNDLMIPSRYQLIMNRGGDAWFTKYWPVSFKAFQSALPEVLAEDPDAVFIVNYPIALGSSTYTSALGRIEPILPEILEQYTPSYSVVLARAFGRAAFEVHANYPNGGTHSEAYVVISSRLFGELSEGGTCLLPYAFGLWPYREALRGDYVAWGVAPAVPWVTAPDGHWENIEL